MKVNRLHIVLPIVSFIITFLLFLIVFGLFDLSHFRYFFSSDTLYLPSIYKDLFIDGNTVQGWEFNPAPNFFPDMPLYFLIMKLCGGNFLVASMAYPMVQFYLILFLSYNCLRFFFEKKKSLVLISFSGILISLFLLHFLETNWIETPFQLLSNSYHLGAFVNSLLGMYLILLFVLKEKKWAIALLFLLVFIASFSDKLFVAQFTGVGTLIFIFSVVIDKSLLRSKWMMVVITTIVSSVLGIVVFGNINPEFISFGTPASQGADWEVIKFSIWDQFKHLKDILKDSDTGAAIVLLCLLSLLLLLKLSWQNRKVRNVIFWCSSVSFLFIVGNFLLPATTGSYVGYDCMRYNMNTYLMALTLLPFVASFFLSEKVILRLFSVMSFVMILIISLNITAIGNLESYANHQPESTKNLDKLKEEYQLKNGIGDYWDAKFNTMFSKNDVRIYSVHFDLRAYYHVTNSNWYYQNPDGSLAVFNFIVLDGPIKLEAINKIFKEVELITEGNITICKTPDFVIEKSGQTPVLLNSLKENQSP